MSFSPIVSIMAASVALSSARNAHTSSMLRSTSRRRASASSSTKAVNAPPKQQTPEQVEANRVKQRAAAAAKKIADQRAAHEWLLAKYRKGRMTNAELMHNLQHNKGFLEFVEAALKDKP